MTDAIREPTHLVGKVSEAERRWLREVFEILLPKIPVRPARRRGARRHPVV